MKKILLTLIVIILLIGCDSSVSKLSGEKEFAEFTAEVLCISNEYEQKMDNVEDDEVLKTLSFDFQDALSDKMEKYDYTLRESTELVRKYDGDTEFQKSVLERAKKLCPEMGAVLEENIAEME